MFNFLGLIMNPNKYRLAVGEFELSMVYGTSNYSDSTSLEIAVLYNNRIIVPVGMESFYNGDTVIGWQNEDQVKAFCQTLCEEVRVEYTSDMDAYISDVFSRL